MESGFESKCCGHAKRVSVSILWFPVPVSHQYFFSFKIGPCLARDKARGNRSQNYVTSVPQLWCTKWTSQYRYLNTVSYTVFSPVARQDTVREMPDSNSNCCAWQVGASVFKSHNSCYHGGGGNRLIWCLRIDLLCGVVPGKVLFPYSFLRAVTFLKMGLPSPG